MRHVTTSEAGLIRGLVREKKVRDVERAFVVEGIRPIGELLVSNPDYFQALIVAETGLERTEAAWLNRAKECGCPIYHCTVRLFRTLSDMTTPSGMLAVLRQPRWDPDVVLKQPEVFGFYGEGLQDPANVGPMIRSAVAFGVDGFWLSMDSVDVFNPKVVRATAGALLKLPIFSISRASTFAAYQCALLTAELPAPRTRAIHDIRTIPSRAIVAFGNESRGLSDSTIRHASIRFHIPIRAEAESLNVASAAAIAAFAFSPLRHQLRRHKSSRRVLNTD